MLQQRSDDQENLPKFKLSIRKKKKGDLSDFEYFRKCRSTGIFQHNQEGDSH